MDVNVETNIDSKWMELYESTVNALFAYANICLCAVHNESARGERKKMLLLSLLTIELNCTHFHMSEP